MQLVGAHQIFGDLCNFAVLGGQKLRRDRCGQNIQQHIVQSSGGGSFGFVLHQIAYQRFGHAGVYAVHAHVVAVVGRPAQRQLRKIARAHHKAAGAVGKVHQLQRAHTRLPVFKGDVQHIFVLPDIRKVAAHGVGDADLLKAHAQLPAQNFGVAAGALGGAKAGHGNRQHIGGGAVQLLHGAHCHQQGKAAVQTAGNANDRRFGASVFQPLGKAIGLHFQDQLAPGGTALRVAGHKGRGVDAAGEHRFLRCKIKFHRDIALGAVLKAGVAGALGFHALAVQLGLGVVARKGRRLGQNAAVLGDQVVPGKHHVGGAFAVPCRGVQVAAQQPGGLVCHQCAAVLGLAHGLVAGRKVCNDGSARQRVEGGRRQRAPQVLAQLHAQHKAGHLAAAEQKRGAKGHLLPADGHRLHLRAAGGELPFFVKLAVVGQVGLGHDAQQLPAAQHGGAVVQFAVHQKRQAHQRHGIQRAGLRKQPFQRIQCTLLQRALQKQIAAGVAGKAELRKYRQLYPALCGRLQLRQNLLRVIGAVCHPQGGRKGSCF